jgi:hypothetical protein
VNDDAFSDFVVSLPFHSLTYPNGRVEWCVFPISRRGSRVVREIRAGGFFPWVFCPPQPNKASAGNQGDWESLVGGMDFAAELGRAWGMNTKYPRRPVCVLAEGEEDGPPED